MQEANTQGPIVVNQLYEALTGKNTIFGDGPRTFFGYGGHYVTIDATTQSGRDKAFSLVERMAKGLSSPETIQYYAEDFSKIHTAYLTGDPEDFKTALQSLADSIALE